MKNFKWCEWCVWEEDNKEEPHLIVAEGCRDAAEKCFYIFYKDRKDIFHLIVQEYRRVKRVRVIIRPGTLGIAEVLNVLPRG